MDSNSSQRQGWGEFSDRRHSYSIWAWLLLNHDKKALEGNVWKQDSNQVEERVRVSWFCFIIVDLLLILETCCPSTHQGLVSLSLLHLPFPSVGNPSPEVRTTLHLCLQLALPKSSLEAQLVKNPPAMQETWARLIPGLGRSPGEGKGNPLQCSSLENPMDRGAWRAIVHGVTKESDMTEQLYTLLQESK